MKQFFFFGDSITLGVGDQGFVGWPAVLAQMLSAQGAIAHPDTIYNLGARKNSSADIAARWRQEFQRRHIQGTEAFLVFCFGTVDMAAPQGRINVPAEESAANARNILSEAQQSGNVLLVSPPPVADSAHSARLESLGKAYAEVCAELSVPFVDMFHALDASPFLQDLADGVHPGAEGNRLIAAALLHSSGLKILLRQAINA
jgi:lysophospholipase L1-like esterase